MTCRNHPNAEAVAACACCRSPICRECAVVLDEGVWCRDCLGAAAASYARSPARRQNRLVAALLSIIPGVGHMYLGMIGKGFALLGILLAAIFLVILYSATTAMYWITAYLVPSLVVLFLSYAIFDAIAAADLARAGRDPASGDDAIMRFVWERIFLNGRFAGYVLLVAGVIGLLDLIARPLARFLHAALAFDLPASALVIPIVLLLAGIYMVRKGSPRG